MIDYQREPFPSKWIKRRCGDYWANSYKRSLGYWQETDQQYYWVFGWDGHNFLVWAHYQLWSHLSRRPNRRNSHRRPDLGLRFDGNLGTDRQGQIRHRFLEGLAMTNSGTNQQQAAMPPFAKQQLIWVYSVWWHQCHDRIALKPRATYCLPTFHDPESCGVTSIAVSNISAFVMITEP